MSQADQEHACFHCGLPIPPGFVITAPAYRQVVEEARITERIDDLLLDLDRSLCEELVWRMRLAFFRDARNIADLSCLFDLSDELALPAELMRALGGDDD